MSRRIHQKHAQEHDMTSHTPWCHVMDLNRKHRSQLAFFDIEEVDVVGRNMYDGKEEHGIGNLAMKPLRFVQGQESQLWSDVAKQGAAHGQDDEKSIEREHQAGSTR